MEGNAFKSLTLDVIVPAQDNVDIQSALTTPNQTFSTSANIDDAIPQRRFLFLDETITVYAVLKSPAELESAISSILPRLKINVEVGVIGTSAEPPSRQVDPRKPAPSAKSGEIIRIISVDPESDPIRVECSASGPESTDYILRFWPLQVKLTRPRSKLLKISNYFHPSGYITAITPLKVPQSDYLPSGAPAAQNLLDSLGHEPDFADTKPRLSVLRMTKVVPATSSNEQPGYSVRPARPRTIRVGPLILWRIRYMKPHEPPKSNSVIACLDFDISYFASCTVSIKTVSLTLSSGQVEFLTPTAFPIQCNNGDQFGHLYRLLPSPDLTEMMGNQNREHELSIRLTAEVIHTDGRCKSNLDVDWSMGMDFSTQTKFGHKRTRSALLNQNTSIEIPKSHISRQLPSATMPQSMTTHTLSSGVVLGVKSPSRVTVGTVFSWKILVINRSPAVVRLGLYVVPLKQNASFRRVDPDISNLNHYSIAPPPPTQVQRASTDGRSQGRRNGGGFGALDAQEEWIPDPVIAANSLLFQQYGAELDQPGMLCLSPETRIGPLAPAACFSTEVKFLPTASGVLQVEAVRIVDLLTHQVVDVRDLPDVMCQGS